MYAKKANQKLLSNGLPVRYQCQSCAEIFSTFNIEPTCPYCFCSGCTNLIVLYLEDDVDKTQLLDLIDFSAG